MKAARSSARTDRRSQTGFRVLFNRQTERDAWYLAMFLKRLSPERRRQLRGLAEAMLIEDQTAAAETVTPEHAR